MTAPVETNVIMGFLSGEGIWCIDTPISAFHDQSSVIDLRGWIALPSTIGTVDGPRLIDEAGQYYLNRVQRGDVESELPERLIVGFDHVVELDSLLRSKTLLTLDVDEDQIELELPEVTDLKSRSEAFVAAKEHKLDRLSKVVVCPECGHELVVESDGLVCCAGCMHKGRRTRRSFDLRPRGIDPFELLPPFSSHSYDIEPREMISEFAGGLVLDAGSGLRYEYFEDVVNLDLSAFPTTDLIGSCASIPLASGSMDGAISVAVLEHLEDPRDCVKELARVIKPGGAVYAAVPFLQPFHGYPSHYFNMTRDGLVSIFSPFFDIEDVYTPNGGLPIRAVSWILDWYLSGLPDKERAEFSSRTIGEIAGDPTSHLDQGYVTALDEGVTATLACVNVIVGSRRLE